jgi:hypothetical protein
MTVRCELAGQIHPLTGEPRRRNGHAPRDPVPLSVQPARFRREIAATYDAARDSDDFRRYWAHADGLDPDSANSRSVRSKLVNRSRYEVANNGFADGMTQTYANYLVGKGPALRIQELDADFARRIEAVWYRWSKQILLRRKLWCMAHAKVQDGEPFGIVRSNLAIRHPVKLDLVLIETEQCQTPNLPFQVPGYIDGIKFIFHKTGCTAAPKPQARAIVAQQHRTSTAHRRRNVLQPLPLATRPRRNFLSVGDIGLYSFRFPFHFPPPSVRGREVSIVLSGEFRIDRDSCTHVCHLSTRFGCKQLRQPTQVDHRRGEREQQLDPGKSALLHPTHDAVLLGVAEYGLDELSRELAQAIAGVARGALVDAARSARRSARRAA